MEAIQQNGADLAEAVGFDPAGGALETARAQCQTAAIELVVHFAINGQEGLGERRIGKRGAQPRAVASGRRKLGYGARQRRAESRHVHYAREFGTVDAARGLFDDQVHDRIRGLRRIAGPGLDESGQGLD